MLTLVVASKHCPVKQPMYVTRDNIFHLMVAPVLLSSVSSRHATHWFATLTTLSLYLDTKWQIAKACRRFLSPYSNVSMPKASRVRRPDSEVLLRQPDSEVPVSRDQTPDMHAEPPLPVVLVYPRTVWIAIDSCH